MNWLYASKKSYIRFFFFFLLEACRFRKVWDVMGLQTAAPDTLIRFDQNAFVSAGYSPSPPPLLLPPLRPGGKAGQQMARPYPSASDEWRMMSSRAWQAPVYVHKGGLSFWGHAAGSLPIFKSAWQIFNGGSWIYVSDDFYLTSAWKATQQSPESLPLSACSEGNSGVTLNLFPPHQ